LVNSAENEWGISIHAGNRVALFSRNLISVQGGEAIRVKLNEDAIAQSDMDPDTAGNISLVMLKMADEAVQMASAQKQEKIAEPEPVTREEPVQESIAREQPEMGPTTKTDPGKLVFRVQIISSLYTNSFPTVLVDGKSYKTYEYFYKGSYRITVGEFESVQEADAFKVKCRNSGFKQAFVAAFRGDQRETDPSVFKQ
jgi:hypothetical protein